MAIAVAAGSPIFSPPMRTHSCNSNQDNFIPQFTASPSSSSPSPYRSRFLKQATGRRISPDFSSTTASTTASVTSLKRKRPARLDIPELESTSCFGFEAVDEGKRCGGVDEVEADSTRFSVFCKKGKVKQSMDDRYCAGVDICGDSKLAFFGVFDGHGGSKAAEFAASNVEKNVIAAIREEEEEEDEQVSNNQARFEEAVRIAYLRTDSDLLKQEVPGGSCAVTALIMNDDDLVVSNAGDCRAVISKGGVAEAVTSDHRPSREDEKNRIESNGGYVDCIRGIWRLQGTLAVSRGLGDSHLKHWVIADPETTVLKIDSECEFLILASDGLWDKVSNQEAVDTVRSMWVNSSSTSSNNSPPSLQRHIDVLAHKQVRQILWTGLGFFIAQTGVFFRLTFWEFSWDVMEPVAFFTTTSGLIVGYAYFLFTSRDPTYQDLMKRLYLSRRRKLIQKHKFDIDRFLELQKHCKCPLEHIDGLELDESDKV